MADKTIEVEDEGTVTVDVRDIEGLENQGNDAGPVVAAVEPEEPEVAPEPKPSKRQREAKVNDAAAEASAALEQAVKTAETAEAARKAEEQARRAAEATALAERRRAEDSARLAAQREQEAQGYREQAESRELTLINNGIESATRELDSAGTEWERAQSEGDFAKAKTAMSRHAVAAAKLDRLNTDKENYEANAARRASTEGRVAEPQPTAPTSAFEQYLSRFDPVAQTWLRNHPDCVPSEAGGDRAKNAKMMAGHYDAVAQGLPLNSPDYYRVIEEHTGHRTPVSAAATVVTAGDDPTPQPSSAPRPKPRIAQPSAPVTRDAPGPSGAPMTRQVTLTPQQQEIALISFQQNPGEKDSDFRKRAFGTYASELIKATNEGRIGPNRFDRM